MTKRGRRKASKHLVNEAHRPVLAVPRSRQA
jgi:hypothetical protein